MKSGHSPFWFAFVLPFVPSLAQADEQSLVEWTRSRVQDGLVKPLSKQERGFSRSRPEPHERRVRVLSAVPSRDKKDRAFVAYAIDVRYGSEWRENDIVGCAYRGSGNLYVKIGDEHRPAAFLLGEDAAPVADACVASSPPRA